MVQNATTAPPQPFDRPAHEAAGQMLHRIRGELTNLATLIESSYGKSAKPAWHAAGAVEALGLLRSALDHQAGLDLGDEFSGRIYFPASLND